MRIDRSKFSTQSLRFPKYAPFGRAISSTIVLQTPAKKNKYLTPTMAVRRLWTLPQRSPRNFQQHTAAINKRAFSYNWLPIDSKVHVQNAINKLWNQHATVVAIRNNSESYIVQLENGKQCICGRILLRPANTTAISSMTKCASPVPAQRTTHTTAQPQPTLRRSARLQNRV